MIEPGFIVLAVLCVLSFIAGTVFSVVRCERKGGIDVQQTH